MFALQSMLLAAAFAGVSSAAPAGSALAARHPGYDCTCNSLPSVLTFVKAEVNKIVVKLSASIPHEIISSLPYRSAILQTPTSKLVALSMPKLPSTPSSNSMSSSKLPSTTSSLSSKPTSTPSLVDSPSMPLLS
jgi:hypothetical protein